MYCTIGFLPTGSISFGCDFVAGSNRVPKPATGMTALRIDTMAPIPESGIHFKNREERLRNRRKKTEQTEALKPFCLFRLFRFFRNLLFAYLLAALTFTGKFSSPSSS